MQEAWHFPKANTKLPIYYINITTYSYYESLFYDNIISFFVYHFRRSMHINNSDIQYNRYIAQERCTRYNIM
jgi:hypothetical protein